MKGITIAAFILLVSFTLAAPAVSQTSSGPKDSVRESTNKVIAVLNNPDLKGPAKESERRKKIREAVMERFDFGEMAKRSLGIYWKDRSAAEKKEFTGLFSDLLERSYINRIEGYTDEKISYDNESIDGDYAVVKTRLRTKRGEEIPIDYKLMNESGKWMVYDLVIENVSLVNNYRVQFNKVIRSTSYTELVKKMKNKSESEAFAAPQPKAK